MKKRLLTSFAAAAMLTSVAVPAVNTTMMNQASSQRVSAATADQTAFLNKAAKQAVKAAKKYGTLPSVMIAQAITESGWGKSGLAVNANNLFGMKADGSWTGETYTTKTREDYQEEKFENSLRPKILDEYIGQDKVKENMKIYIEAAKKRGEPLDHVLLYGPPGLGKTTLANIISNEMNSNIKITSGPAIEKPGDLAALLTNLSEFDVLFIDEIHRLSKSVEEILYPALEDYTLDIMIGKGPSARSIRLDLPKFTLIGATTKAGSLTTPLRDRFGIVHRLELYGVEDLTTIVKRSAKILGVEIDNESAVEVARRSRGTPRIANRLLKRVRDYATVLGDGRITLKITKTALNKLEIDEMGLDEIDRKILETLIIKYQGRPVGIETIATTIGEEIDTLEDVYEPYLIQIGFVSRTVRGRIALPAAYKHIGVPYDGGDSSNGYVQCHF